MYDHDNDDDDDDDDGWFIRPCHQWPMPKTISTSLKALLTRHVSDNNGQLSCEQATIQPTLTANN